jgi:histidinol dehydrogenase
MKVIEYPARKDWNQILKRPVLDNAALEITIAAILQEVKKSGDKAVIDFTWKFDKVKVDSLLVSEEEFKKAKEEVSQDLKEAIKTAYGNIEKFHLSQKEEEKKTETIPGVLCWRKSVAISKVGIYIPGGTAPLFSTILMLGIPAKIAGCEEIVLCTPPDKEGKINKAILYTADVLGIRKVYKAGGAQAIAAMAYGTESISKVYKIFGPGNQYVTAAKQMVSKEGIAIDMPAGPSEVAVLADVHCKPSFVAADLLSQAEHGVDSQAILVSDNKSVIDKVKIEVAGQLNQLPRKEIASKALENSLYILVKDLDEGMDLLNEYAPEHLILQVANADHLASKVINAGSVFIGAYSPEAAGDYASGTNHTLPTNGYAKAYSGVSLDSFIKKITFQKLSKEGIQKLGPAIEIMAESEGLFAHKNAVSLRIKA